MTPIKRSIPQPDGSVMLKTRRGPYVTESLSASGRPIVIELHPHHVVLRELGCRRRTQLSYPFLELAAAKAEAERIRREKKQRGRGGRGNAAGMTAPTPRRAVRRGVLI